MGRERQQASLSTKCMWQRTAGPPIQENWSPSLKVDKRTKLKVRVCLSTSLKGMCQHLKRESWKDLTALVKSSTQVERPQVLKGPKFWILLKKTGVGWCRVTAHKCSGFVLFLSSLKPYPHLKKKTWRKWKLMRPKESTIWTLKQRTVESSDILKSRNSPTSAPKETIILGFVQDSVFFLGEFVFQKYGNWGFLKVFNHQISKFIQISPYSTSGSIKQPKRL